MKPSDRRAAMKQDMAARHQESYDHKDDSGRFKSIFIKEKISGISMWKCSEDEHFINIIPFVAGANHPSVKQDKWAYNLDVFVHRKVGVNEDSYVCLARTYNKPCPICEHQAELRKADDYDENYVKSLNPTRRVIYNIECLDSDKETAKGIQLFEVSHWLFEKEIAELAKIPRTGSFILFSDPDEGKTIFFRKKGSGATNTEFKAFKFEDRDEPIPDSVLDKAHCLDELIHIPTYAEVKSAFLGSEIDESEIGEQYREEVKQEVAESRRSSRRVAKEETKKEETNDEDFVCPGNAPDDFGTFDACDSCPDAAECEKEFNAAEDAKAEAAKKAEEAKAAEAGATRRVRRSPSDTPASEPEKTETVTQEEPTRRVRRRPGQD